MKYYLILLLCGLLLVLSGCQEAAPVCPTLTSTPIFLSVPPDDLPTSTPPAGPIKMMIGNNEMQVDKVVSGPLCNDTWRGNVYVTCDVQVYAWQEEPTFLKDCELNIEPMTVVYVANHNNTAYYNGCSCHSGVTPEP